MRDGGSNHRVQRGWAQLPLTGQCFDLVSEHCLIRRYKHKIMCQGLANKHSVKGVAMKGRQGRQDAYRGFIQVPWRDSKTLAPGGQVSLRRCWQPEFARAGFDETFPERNNAQEDVIFWRDYNFAPACWHAQISR